MFDYWICLWCGAVFQTATEPCSRCGSLKNFCMQSPLDLAELSRLLTNLSEFGEYASASIDRWISSLRECTDLLAAGLETQTFAKRSHQMQGPFHKH